MQLFTIYLLNVIHDRLVSNCTEVYFLNLNVTFKDNVLIKSSRNVRDSPSDDYQKNLLTNWKRILKEEH